MSAIPASLWFRLKAAARPGNLLRSVGLGIFKRLLSFIVMAPFVFAGSALVHIWLMAVKYDGFNVSWGADVIGKGNYINGVFKWSAVPFLLFFLVGLARSYGFGMLTRQLVQSPRGFALVGGEMGRVFGDRKVMAFALMCLGGSMLGSAVVVKVMGGSSFLFLFGVAGVLVALAAIRNRDATELALPLPQQFWLSCLALGTGFLMGWIGLGWTGVLVLGLGLFLKFQKDGPRGAGGGGVASLLTAGVLLAFRVQGLADDGGWSEYASGKQNPNLADYLSTPEGQLVIKHGLAAGMLSTISSFAGYLLGGLFGTSLQRVPGFPPLSAASGVPALPPVPGAGFELPGTPQIPAPTPFGTVPNLPSSSDLANMVQKAGQWVTDPAVVGAAAERFLTFGNLIKAISPITSVIDHYDMVANDAKTVDRLKDAMKAWHDAPSKLTGQKYVEAVQNLESMKFKRLNDALGKIGMAADVVDAVKNAQEVIERRGYAGWEKAGAYYVEGANKVILNTIFNKMNPLVSVADTVAGLATEKILGTKIDTEGLVRAGEEKWHEVTKEYANNVSGSVASDAEIKTKDQFLDFAKRIKQQVSEGKIDRAEGAARMRKLWNVMGG